MKLTPVFSAVLLSLVFCSCDNAPPAPQPAAPAKPAAAPKEKGKMVIGFSQVGAESVWRTAETDSIQNEAKLRGVDLRFVDAQGKQENQIKALRSFAAQKVDAVILAPKVETGWGPVLLDLQREKIPVILVDRGIKVKEPGLFVSLVASDFVEEGWRAGEWLAKKMNGKANIVQLEGTVGSAPANDRRAGFERGLKRYPDMKIILTQSGDFNRAKGKEVMEAFLKSKGKEINAVYAHNDDMALGAIQAIEEAGLKPGKDIIIVSIDGVKEAFEAIVAGKLNCTVECNPLLGTTVFDLLDSIRNGDTPPQKMVVHDELYDEANAAQALPSRKY